MSLVTHKNVQAIAKDVLKSLQQHIYSTSTEKTIARKASELLAERGITDTWYHNVPAFVLLGSRSCVSISGKDYKPDTEEVGKTNLITVDLSPLKECVWGDCARSYVVENGKYTRNPKNKDFLEGISIQRKLHNSMRNFVKPQTLFSELHAFGNSQIKKYGFKNLDFLGNLGHSIETNLSKRLFIDKNEHKPLGSVKYFTFEPHIKHTNGFWGYKHENIYYFDESGSATEL